VEQVGFEARESEPRGDAVGAGRRGGVAGVDEPEQQRQGFVEVAAGAGFRAGQFGQREVAETVQAVALLVFAGADGQHAQFGGRLGVQQEQDAVQEPQRLLGQRLGLCLG